MLVRVAHKRLEAQDICSFELVPADGTTLPAFSAGSHIDVQLPNGITRQYSLCNDAAETHRYLIGVLKTPDGRGGSVAMHQQVHEGDLLSISAPRNHFALAHGASHSLLFAGGIGITPILCMAERLHHTGESFSLHYSARSLRRAAFAQRIDTSGFADQVHWHLDDGPAGQRLDLPACLAGPQPETHLYVCGPKGYIDAVLDTARSAGWHETRLHYEFFTAQPQLLWDDGSFEVQLASSGRVIAVAADQTVVQALVTAGVQVPISCEQGICGTCLTRVLAGNPDHRDLFLSPEEQAANDQFLPCCSRAKTARLVLDL